jgi:hypothetical protein
MSRSNLELPRNKFAETVVGYTSEEAGTRVLASAAGSKSILMIN